MTGTVHISARARNLIVICLAGLYLAICAFALVSTRGWIGRPFPGFLVSKSNAIAVISLAGWEAREKELKYKDIVTAVSGTPVTSSDELYRMIEQAGAGKSLTLSINPRNGEPRDVTITVKPFTLKDYLILFIGLMAIGGAIYGAGLVVLFLKPASPVSWALMFFCFVYGVTDAGVAEFYTNHRLFYLFFTITLTGPSLLLISLYFPVELRKKWPWIIFMAASVVVVLGINAHFADDPLAFRKATVSSVIQAHLLRLIAIGVMLRSFYLAKDPLVRQRAKVVVFGFALAFAVIIAINVANIFFGKGELIWTIAIWLAVPLTIGYAMLKHNLFDVDVFIRKSLSYLIVSGAAVAALYLTAGRLSLALQESTGQSSQTFAVIATLLVVTVFRPMQRRVFLAIDRRFDRERHEYAATIRKAGGILASIIELDKLLSELLATALDAMRIERGVILLREGTGRFSPAAAAGYAAGPGVRDLDLDHPLLARLQERKQAAQLHDLSDLGANEQGRGPMLALMEQLQAVLVIPVVYEARLIGALGLGAKKSGAGYSTEDVELLQTLMIQTAVAIENARKVEELKKMVELETSYRELQRLDEMKDNFLSMVSHDLRTPMTSIKGYASLLNEKGERFDPDRRKRYLQIIIAESDRLTRLINDLLDLQRLEAGKMKFDLARLDLREIAEESAAAFQGAALAKNITLSRQLPRTPAWALADRDRLAQVMANLLSNAVKFTPADGRVNLRLEILDHDPGPRVRVTVSDTGPGIAAEEQARLFNKFHQVDRLVRDKEQGSGLGLALVREIVERHNGEVGLDSEPGRGSSFYFILPAAADKED